MEELKRIIDWYMVNIKMLEAYYGEIKYDKRGNFGWVLIENYCLPLSFYESSARLVISTPSLNLADYKNFIFYLDGNLAWPYKHQRKHLGNRFERNLDPIENSGYSRIDFHLHSFCPSSNATEGDNLLTLCRDLYFYLEDESDPLPTNKGFKGYEELIMHNNPVA